MQAPFPEHYLITPEPSTYGETVSSSASSATAAIGASIRESTKTSTTAASATSTAAAHDAEVSYNGFLQDVDASLSAGIKLVQLRSKLLTPPAFAALAKQAAILCHRAGAQLIVNGALHAWESAEKHIAEGDITETAPASFSGGERLFAALQAEIDALGADGIHLSSAQLMRCSRRPLRTGQWVSAACHSLTELQRAAALPLDFVTLSPVLHTATHPDAEPLGWERFAALIRASRTSSTVTMPIFALGGMEAADVARAQAHGAHGIAAIRSLWVRKSH